jgi:hypothetical protein
MVGSRRGSLIFATASVCALFLVLFLGLDASAALRHQYTFNDNTANDSVGGAHGIVVDPMGIAQYRGGQIDVSANENNALSGQNFSLPTANGAYVNLPNGIVSAAFNSGTARAASFETWTTTQTNRGWAELFSFGLSNQGEDMAGAGDQRDYITLIPQTGTSPAFFRITTHTAGVPAEGFAETTTLGTGVQHHIVVTADHNDLSGGTNGTLKLYLNNNLVDSGPISQLIELGSMLDDNNWLGRSQWNDPLFDGSYNEFRIYDHVLNATEVATNFTQGPVPAPLPSLTVNRDTGQITITNTTPGAVQLNSYSISSNAGALAIRPAWDPIAPANGWTIQTESDATLAETGGTAVTLAGNGGSTTLGTAWTKSPFEDLQFNFVAGGVPGSGTVTYTGNNGVAFGRSDLDTDGDIDPNDYNILLQNNFADVAGLSTVAGYRRGDLDGDGDNDQVDFRLFKADYNVANGSGSFNQLLAGVPEPAALTLLVTSIVGLALVRQRRRSTSVRWLLVALIAVVPLAVADPADAALKHQYTFNDSSIEDSAGTADGTIIDPGMITRFTQGGRLDLSGNDGQGSDQTPFASGAYVNLPNDMMSAAFSSGTAGAATFETWVSVATHRNWAEIYAFGTSNAGEDDAERADLTDYITLIPFNGAGSGTLWTVAHPDNGGDAPADAGVVLPTGIWNQHHIVSVFDHNDTTAGPNGTIRQYLNGAPAGTTAIHANIDLNTFVNNNNWLGRSQWNDPLFDGHYDEFRIYDHALTAQEVSENSAEGPTLPDRLTLEVNTVTGAVALKNTGPIPVNMDLYRIESAGGALNEAGWNSLSDQNFDPDGPGPGQNWDESGGSDQFGLSEVFLLGDSTLATSASVPLGMAFNPAVFGSGNNGDLEFFITDPTGEELRGLIDYVTTGGGLPGDYNNNGRVDAADYVTWRKNPAAHGGNPAGYNTWRMNFGRTAGSGLGAGSAVPEPAGFVFFVVSALLLFVRRNRGCS